MRRLFVAILISFGVWACGEHPEEPQIAEPNEKRIPGPGRVFSSWRVEALANDPDFNVLLQTGSGNGAFNLVQAIGPMAVNPQGGSTIADARLFSDETGSTYWAGVQAPTSPGGLSAPDSLIGGEAALRQVWRYRKNAPNAELRFIISQTFLEGLDHNGQDVDFDDCPWWVGGPVAQFPVECAGLIKGEVEAAFYAYAEPASRADPVDVFYYASGSALLFGFADRWSVDAYADATSLSPMFAGAAFDNDLNVDGTGRHARSRLSEPIVLEIPLDSIARGTEFEVVGFVTVRAYSRRQGESYISAYFRDPLSTEGLEVETHGLLLIDPPAEIPALRWTPPPAQCTGAAGVIAFDTTAYLHPEWPGDRARIIVTRTGGSGSAATAVFSTGGGSATAGVDYTPVTTIVRFEAGEEGRRAVSVPILADTLAEQNETVTLSLSSPACASLGESSAELTIFDDDTDHTPPLFSLGGTVTGLVGSGLVLRNGGDLVAITADGPFAFPGAYPSGDAYDVTVEQQPSNPLQACTVTNGQGTIGSADVTDVLVTCRTPAGGGLDLGFGTNGLVSTDLIPYSADERFAAAVALQADGKILVAGERELARFNADGTLDASFGSGGIVPVQFRTVRDAVLDVAVQPDGRILVAGIARDLVNLPANDDFAVARFEADGTLDTGFGVDGVAFADFAGRVDGADDILIQPDGSIVVVGTAHSVNQFGAADADFGIARFTSAGVLDSTFSVDGKTTIDIAGRSDGAHAGALLPDGRIVVTGRAAVSGGSDPDIAIVRVDASGAMDPTFGNGGIVWTPTSEYEWAVELALDASGRVLVSGHADSSAFVARYGVDGAADASFGGGGMVLAPALSRANGMAVDAAGRIIVVGASGGDFAVMRVNDDGTLDTSFGNNGVLTVDFFAGFDQATDVVIQPDGKILVVGKIENNLTRRVGLVRVQP